MSRKKWILTLVGVLIVAFILWRIFAGPGKSKGPGEFGWPVHHALLGPAPEVENFYLANGSSGHGVMHAPALGQLLSEMIVDGAARSVDVEALRPSRFAEGRPNAAPDLL